MAELPSGTVTFLFTDIEGSTRLLKQLGEGYRDVLTAHRRILREAVEVREGWRWIPRVIRSSSPSAPTRR